MDHLQAQSDRSNLNTGAALVTEGWHVEQRGEQATVLDTDLAEHAGLTQPRAIRRTIATLIEDGALVDGGTGNPANDDPCFWLEAMQVVSGKGRVEDVTSYRLNKTGALFVVTRLRTPKAVELTLAIVKVFDQVTSGRLAAPVGPSNAQILAALSDLTGAVASLVAMNQREPAHAVYATVSDFAGESFARTITAKVATYAGLMSNYTPARFREWRSRAHNQLRTRVDYPMGHGRSWARLPAQRRADVILALDEMLSDAKKVYGDRGQLGLMPSA